MKVERFVADRTPSWSELDSLVRRAGRRPERLGPDGVLRLGALYRGAAADLAYVQRAFAREPFLPRLEELVGRARSLVYDARTSRSSFTAFFRRDYWRLVAGRPRLLLISAVLLFGSALLAGGWAVAAPERAGGLVPGAYDAVTQPRPHGANLELSPGVESALSTRIFTNNIEVTFLAFAGGILLGLGTIFVLLQNGVMLGAVAGLAIGSGNGRIFFELVTAHGVLELSCIVVAGAAGLRLGWSIVDPGLKTRRKSVLEEGRRAIAIVLGTMPWLVVAGLVEGFVTPSGLGLPVVLAVGLGLGALYWGLVYLLGFRGAREPSSAGTT